MGEPRVSAPRATEALHGEVLEVLEQRAEWLRVRAPDGYIAWLNTGYIATGPTDWAEDWTERATARSLSADIVTAEGRRRLPTGARVALRRGVVELADGQPGAVAAGSVRREQELRVEARHLALPELAQKWCAGAGRIVHAALSRGGVGGDHLFGDEPRMVRLRETLVGVRRPG